MKRIHVAKLLLVGLTGGFLLSVGLFACSTRVDPAASVSAQDSAMAGRAEVLSLQAAFREVSSMALPSVVRIDVEEVRRRDAPQGDNAPFFDFFFGQPDDNGDDEDALPEFRSQGLGSGVVVQRDGRSFYVLTNAHVIGNADEITVTLDDGDEYEARLVGSDARKDLALIAFDSDAAIPVAQLGDSDGLRVGDWVLAIGSPFGFQSTVTAGIVSALGRRGGPDGNISDFIQTDAAINRGDSGGALVNLNGEVVGINTWITSQTGGSVGLGFSIPINNVKRSITDFIERGAVRYGWLGVSIRSVSPEVQESLRIEDRRGALVHHVFIDSPGDIGGLLPGDFIVSINGADVDDSDELVLLVGELPVEEIASFVLIRNGERTTVDVRIGERESDEAIANLNTRLWPGFSVFPVTEELREELELGDQRGGIVVSTVDNRTPAAIAGLRVGDLVTEINERQVADMAEFYAALNGSGGTVSITVVRDGSEVQLGLRR